MHALMWVWNLRLHIALAAAVWVLSGCSASPSGEPPIRDGNARFAVITPTLIRLEYAEDGRFEDRPTQTIGTRPARTTPYTTWVENGERFVQTEALTLRYRQGSGPFATDNLEVSFTRGTETVTVTPVFGDSSTDPERLGGWLRSLDLVQEVIETRPGILSRRGHHLVDDSNTALLTSSSPGYAPRPAREGAYQDGYFFAYGLDYRRALEDLRALTGAAPLLPRRAFGVWFSRYWPYSGAEWQALVEEFRQNQVPLSTISIDTDWKEPSPDNFCEIVNSAAGAPKGAPCSWNGWDWNLDLFPDPEGFLAWAHGEGLEVGLNVHPSINGADPAYEEIEERAGELATDDFCQVLQASLRYDCHVFDWGDPAQLEAYFNLHRPLADEGVDFWWLDWCCDDSGIDVPGLTADTWINERYYDEHRRMGSRWPSFSRIGNAYDPDAEVPARGPEQPEGLGALAEHRASLHFTGDTCSTWELIDFAAAFTAGEGAAIGMPYVSHDIGSFHGPRELGEECFVAPFTPVLPDDMYVRWVQLGTFQPLDRLHSQHGRRLPWEYEGEAASVAADFLRLRGRLVPYLYTLAREAHDTGLPMVRALYLSWPELEEAYASPSHFTLGDGVFVATVAAPGPEPTVDFWLPPGQWYDFFDGALLEGDIVQSRAVSLAEYPVYVRAGTILPTQPDLPGGATGPVDELTLHVYTGADGTFSLYEDAGEGLGYEDGQYRWTPIEASEPSPGSHELVIGATSGGTFEGALHSRSWHVRFLGVGAPTSVTLDGVALTEASATPGFTYDAAAGTVRVRTGPKATDAEVRVVLESTTITP